MKKTLALVFLFACFTMSGCGTEANTSVTDGADAAAIENYKALIEAQQKEAGGLDAK
jgi:predicted small secreted protein